MLKIYAERCQHGPFFKEKGWSVEQIMEYIDKQIKEKSDWWLSAAEAVHYGFCDEIALL
jgi:ATP-dependent protease ClpP protease subunit